MIGGGPAGLMAAEILAKSGHRVIVADASPTPARKFLLAGRGGLNLTHSEPLEAFLDRYGPARERLAPAIGRLIPRGASPLERRARRADIRRFERARVSPEFQGDRACCAPGCARWKGSASNCARGIGSPDGRPEGGARFATPSGEEILEAGVTVLALGGASWPRLGAMASWVEILRVAGVDVAPLRAANSGFLVDWSAAFSRALRGPAAESDPMVAGRAILARRGRHNASGRRGRRRLCAVGGACARRCEAEGSAELTLDFKPDVSAEILARRLVRPPGQSLSTFLRKAARFVPPR